MINITDNPDELLDTVNEKDIVTGQARREEVHKNKNLIHRSVGVVIFNKKGEIFLQQRSAGKDTDPTMWTISCSGHAVSSESFQTRTSSARRQNFLVRKASRFQSVLIKLSLLFASSLKYFYSLIQGSVCDLRKFCHAPQNSSIIYTETAHRELREELGVDLPIIPVCKYLCRTPNETEMVMLYKAIYNGPFKLNPKEIIQGKFFTRKELLEAIKPTPSVDRPGKMETRRKRGEHPVPSRRNVGIGAGIKLSFMGKVALEKLGR